MISAVFISVQMPGDILNFPFSLSKLRIQSAIQRKKRTRDYRVNLGVIQPYKTRISRQTDKKEKHMQVSLLNTTPISKYPNIHIKLSPSILVLYFFSFFPIASEWILSVTHRPFLTSKMARLLQRRPRSLECPGGSDCGPRVNHKGLS